MRVHALDVIAYGDGIVTLDLRVSSGTYVRSIADALGGHCVDAAANGGRPFRVEEADEAARACALERGARARLARGAMRIAHAPSQLERQPRAVAIGTFDGVHRGHRAVLRAAIDSGLAPTVITFDPHPRIALGNRVELITTLERRLELLADAGVADTLVAAFTPELMRLDARGVRRDVPAVDRGGGGRRRGGLPLRARVGRARSRRSAQPGSRCCR